jgi:hypothetical protein
MRWCPTGHKLAPITRLTMEQQTMEQQTKDRQGYVVSVLVWLTPIPLAAAAAIGWASWRARPRGPGNPTDTMTDFQRFRTALGNPRPPQRPET